MIYAIIAGTVVIVIAVMLLTARRPADDDTDYKDRLGDYNKDCRLVKIDYRNGKLSADQARARLEEIGDRYGIPAQRRTKSLGAVQIRRDR